MAEAPWVTAGAPLVDGWRVWYAWPADAAPTAPPAPPRVREVGGPERRVLPGGWRLLAPVKGSRRKMAVHALRLAGGVPGALHEVAFEGLAPLRWRTLPAAVPDAGMSVLIASCFWLNDDKSGFYSAAVRELVQREAPVFKLLMGDQLYADVWAPPPVNVHAGVGAKYERYWGDPAYQELLRACPTLVTSDDHEFWNDYPQPQPQVPLSWGPVAADSDAALHAYLDLYQTPLNPGGRRWYAVDVAPVSFFVADTRSQRTRSEADTPSLMAAQQWADLEAWAAGLKGPGVLVLPQPMMKAGGSKTDRTLADFKADYGRIGDLFARALGGADPHDILILTGDIHTGRLSRASILGTQGTIYELVASPASLVTPWLPPWGHEPNPLPDRMQVGTHTWAIEASRQLTATVDNNVGLVRIAPGRNGRTRFTLQLWRVRPFTGIAKRLFGRRPAKGAQPLHDPIELELR